FCLKLASRFPLRELVAIGDLVADFEQKLNILHCAGEVPSGINFIGRLMIMFCDKFVALLSSVIRWFANDLNAAGGVQDGHTSFGEFETVDAIKAAFFRFAVRFHDAFLSRRGLA